MIFPSSSIPEGRRNSPEDILQSVREVREYIESKIDPDLPTENSQQSHKRRISAPDSLDNRRQFGRASNAEFHRDPRFQTILESSLDNDSLCETCKQDLESGRGSYAS